MQAIFLKCFGRASQMDNWTTNLDLSTSLSLSLSRHIYNHLMILIKNDEGKKPKRSLILMES